MSVRSIAFSKGIMNNCGNHRNCSFSADKIHIKSVQGSLPSDIKKQEAEKEHRKNANKLVYSYIALATVITALWILFKVKGDKLIEKLNLPKK